VKTKIKKGLSEYKDAETKNKQQASIVKMLMPYIKVVSKGARVNTSWKETTLISLTSIHFNL